MILFIDACVRKESRTKRLAEACLKCLDGEICHLKLAECSFPLLDGELLEKRDTLIAAGATTADAIVCLTPCFKTVYRTYQCRRDHF